MLKQAYQLGVAIAFEEAGIPKNAGLQSAIKSLQKVNRKAVSKYLPREAAGTLPTNEVVSPFQRALESMKRTNQTAEKALNKA